MNINRTLLFSVHNKKFIELQRGQVQNWTTDHGMQHIY